MSTARSGVTPISTARSGASQELSTAYVREIFENLESGDGKGFFDHVADNVDWIVEGTHPLAGHYHSKADFLAHTFEKLAKVLPQGAQLHTEHALVSGDWAVVESALPSYGEERHAVRQPLLLGLPLREWDDC